jgi:hypothetical protein
LRFFDVLHPELEDIEKPQKGSGRNMSEETGDKNAGRSLENPAFASWYPKRSAPF